jgi:hypothetical protein
VLWKPNQSERAFNPKPIKPIRHFQFQPANSKPWTWIKPIKWQLPACIYQQQLQTTNNYQLLSLVPVGQWRLKTGWQRWIGTGGQLERRDEGADGNLKTAAGGRGRRRCRCSSSGWQRQRYVTSGRRRRQWCPGQPWQPLTLTHQTWWKTEPSNCFSPICLGPN